MIDHRTIHRHFKSADPILAKIVGEVGPCTLKPRRDRFKTLAQAIISQQISTGAAKSIRLKLEKRLEPQGVRPETISRLSIDELRAVGVSRQKASYLLDLAQKCGDGVVQLSRLGRMKDEAVIEQLIQIKGIGRWSAQMFLIFALGRLDVFPLDDFGVRSAIHRLYGFDESPGKAAYEQIGDAWRPYASIGSWYCWRFLDLNPKQRLKT